MLKPVVRIWSESQIQWPTLNKDVYGISIPRPALELPSRSHYKDGDNTIPIGWGQFLRRIDHTVGHSKIAFFASLQQNLIVSAATLLFFVFSADKS